MDTRNVIVVMVLLLLLAVGPTAARPGAPAPSQQSHICGNVTIVCAEGSDSIVPWLSFSISLPLLLVPGILRIWWLAPQQLGLRHTFFVWSLILGLGDYILWSFYTTPCKLNHAQFPIRLTSYYGVLAHVVLVFFVTLKPPTSVSGIRLLSAGAVAVLCLITGGLLYSTGLLSDRAAVLGWLSLGFGVLSHLFRMRGTDYDNFNDILFGFSLLGAVNGLLWLRNPNLCVARHYKIASYLVAVLRGTEVYFWLSPHIGNQITKMEGPEVVGVAVVGANRNIEMGAGQHDN